YELDHQRIATVRFRRTVLRRRISYEASHEIGKPDHVEIIRHARDGIDADIDRPHVDFAEDFDRMLHTCRYPHGVVTWNHPASGIRRHQNHALRGTEKLCPAVAM